MQRKLGEADADGNWQFGSPASASAMDDKTQAVAGHKRRARTAPAAQFSASNLQAAVHHNAAKEKEEGRRVERRTTGRTAARRRLSTIRTE